MIIVGDCHGKVDEFINVIEKNDGAVIQVGDFGFEDAYLKMSAYLRDNPRDVHAILGNHEAHDKVDKYPFLLGDYGYKDIDGFKFFYVSGGYSIDKDYRIKRDKLWHRYLQDEGIHMLINPEGHYSWFPQEELSKDELEKCINLYEEIKPDILLAHEQPSKICKLIGNPDVLRNFGLNKTFSSITSQALQTMINIHEPKVFIGGHLHIKNLVKIKNTIYISLPELGYINISNKTDFDTLTIEDIK